MLKPFGIALPVALLLLPAGFPSGAVAQPATRPADPTPGPSVPPLPRAASAAASRPQGPALLNPGYESAFGDYRSYKEQPVTSWREANDTVRRIGGWRAYAREAQGASADPAASAASASQPAGPTGHSGHHPK